MRDADLDQVDKKVAQAWQLRAQILNDANNEGLKEVRQSLGEAAEFLKAQNDLERLVSVLRKLGHIEQDLGNTKAAINLYKEAYANSKKTGNQLLLAHSARHLADALREGEEYNKAEILFQEALLLYQADATTATLDYANALRSTALLKQQFDKKDEAIMLWQEARDLYGKFGVAEGVDECASALDRLQP